MVCRKLRKVESRRGLHYDEEYMSEYGFEVRNTQWTGMEYAYIVYLPHKCDEWMITDNPNKKDAIKDLTLFIKEANEALDKLKTL